MHLKTAGAVSLIAGAALFAGCRGPAQAASAPAKTVDQSPAAMSTPAPVQVDVNLPSSKLAQAPTAPKKVVKRAARSKPVSNDSAAAPLVAEVIEPQPLVLESRVVVAPQEPQVVAEQLTTLTGCLDRDGDDTFQLKDPSGDQAPRARSWKSGFIRKRTAKVDIVDPAARLNLSQHVGYRISVTGPLVDREMHLRSVRATSERCD